MSNGLAIAAVTAVLKNVLEDGLVQNSALSSMGNVLLTTLPPDQVSVGVDGEPQLNLFLYQVSQNRNADWIGRDRNNLMQPRGKTTDDENAPLAINLHYLLTVYGNKDFQPELLLGYAMELMHQTPVLSNDRIREALQHTASINRAGIFAQAIESTSVNTVSDQLDQVQITPNLLDTEQMSRLWSLLQGSYRPSIAYEVSMVFIGDRKSSLELSSSPDAPERPRIERVVPSPTSGDEITAGSSIIIYGRNFGGEITRIRLNRGKTLLEPDIAEDNRMLFKLPQTLYAGVQQVQVVHQPIYKFKNSQGSMSNEKTFVLYPTISISSVNQDFTDPDQDSQEKTKVTTLTAQFNPRIGQQQKVIFKLIPTNGSSGENLTFEALPRDSDVNEITIAIGHVPAGTYLLHATVDGAESQTSLNQTKNIINLMG
jgi:Pvc16 N-terminal domain